MIDQGDGDREQKQQQRDNLRDVITFCENKIDCRRAQVLGYFGENFDKSQCNRTCDNCERNTELTIVDRTNYALNALKLAQEIDDRYTLIGLLDAFRGSTAKKALKFQDCQNYGAGRELSKSEAERLLQAMVNTQVLRTYNQTNPSGFTTSYVKLGPKWKDLEMGKMKITLTVCENEAPNLKDKPLKTKKAATMTTASKLSTSVTLKRKATVIDSESEGEEEEVGYIDDEFDSFINDEEEIEEEEDSDFQCYEEEIEPKMPSSPVYNNTSLKKKNPVENNYVSISKLEPEYQSILYRGEVSSNINFVGDSKSKLVNSIPITKKDEPVTSKIVSTPGISLSSTISSMTSSVPTSGLCYDYLVQWRDRVAQEKKLNAAFVLSNSVLGQIARQLPLDQEELEKIPGMTHEKISKYGNEILIITNRYIM
jgi:superfamily II DNA helicase RecQ